MSIKKSALGKGLSALLENAGTDITSKPQVSAETTTNNSAVAGGISTIPVNQIETNPFQPRTHFEEQALQELAESIKVHGIIQPVTVRKMGYDKYQLISGERRFRASQLAGLESIPAYVRIANDQAMLEMALVENIQRENLDAIEIAISYRRLIDECSLTQEQLSEKVSKQRSTITNYLRLLKLPAEIQRGIREKSITMGHARALINIENPKTQIDLYKQIITDELSVRDVENMARGEKTVPQRASHEKMRGDLDEKYADKLKALAKQYGGKLELKSNEAGKGRLTIPFDSEENLERLLDILDV